MSFEQGTMGPFGPHRSIFAVNRILAFYCMGATLLALIMEILRFYQEITRLQQRWDAFKAGNLARYDATWTSGCLYLPGTDVPLHPAAVGLTPMWRLITIILLLLCFLMNIPGIRGPTNSIGFMMLIFNRGVSTVYQGFLEAYIALSAFLATLVVFPAGEHVGALNDDTLTMTRYVAGWLLFGCGLFNIVLAFIFGPRLRIYRQQTYFIWPPWRPGMSPYGMQLRIIWPQLRMMLQPLIVCLAHQSFEIYNYARAVEQSYRNSNHAHVGHNRPSDVAVMSNLLANIV